MDEALPQIPNEAGQDRPQFLALGEGALARRIAYCRRPANGDTRAGLVWLCGFKSDMQSTKASYLDRYAAQAGRALVRFDYSGHGASPGDFAAATIGDWLMESLAILDSVTSGRQILVGSSMGGWLALLCARALALRGEEDRLAGLVLIAPAVDFTERLIWDRLPTDARRQIETEGAWSRPSAYSPEPYVITRNLIEEGRRHLLLGGTIRTYCPVHILQGMQDPDVPWQHAVTLVEHLAGDPVVLTLVKDGDHRLSRDEDLARLRHVIDQLG